MNISIIIPTYNRNKVLCNTISNILSFKHQYNELIIVDQTKEHDYETRLFLQKLIKNANVKYLYSDTPNLPNARNIGIANANGDAVLFFDDDVEINEDTIPSHISLLSEKNIGSVTGYVENANFGIDNNTYINNIKKIIKLIIFFFFKKKSAYVGSFGIIANFSCKKIKLSDTCIGCNMSFKKDLLLKAGLFDINYTGNAYREETDMSIRLRRLGFKILYNPSASIIHYRTNSGGTRTDIVEKYWYNIFKNQCYFYVKNFNFSYLHILLIQILDILKCAKLKLNSINIFKNSYKDALYLAGSI